MAENTQYKNETTEREIEASQKVAKSNDSYKGQITARIQGYSSNGTNSFSIIDSDKLNGKIFYCTGFVINIAPGSSCDFYISDIASGDPAIGDDDNVVALSCSSGAQYFVLPFNSPIPIFNGLRAMHTAAAGVVTVTATGS